MTGYAVVLASGRLERLQAVGSTATVAAVSEISVNMFNDVLGVAGVLHRAEDKQVVFV
jgi:peroxiredoxin family protein